MDPDKFNQLDREQRDDLKKKKLGLQLSIVMLILCIVARIFIKLFPTNGAVTELEYISMGCVLLGLIFSPGNPYAARQPFKLKDEEYYNPNTPKGMYEMLRGEYVADGMKVKIAFIIIVLVNMMMNK